jgi:hypothetical protein
VELARSLGVGQRPLHRTAGWVAAQGSWLKFAVNAARRRDLGRLFELEAMALGILGKLSLWEALHAATGSASVGAVRLPDLEARARQQHGLVEQYRLDLALSLFGEEIVAVPSIA